MGTLRRGKGPMGTLLAAREWVGGDVAAREGAVGDIMRRGSMRRRGVATALACGRSTYRDAANACTEEEEEEELTIRTDRPTPGILPILALFGDSRASLSHIVPW
eukprot:1410078-Prymnesium_polylepis.1